MDEKTKDGGGMNPERTIRYKFSLPFKVVAALRSQAAARAAATGNYRPWTRLAADILGRAALGEGQ